jgi:hypothetical protein
VDQPLSRSNGELTQLQCEGNMRIISRNYHVNSLQAWIWFTWSEGKSELGKFTGCRHTDLE